MYRELASKLCIASGTQYSEAVSMDGYNAACVDVTVFTGSVTVSGECGNDLANWSLAGTVPSSALSGPTYSMYPHTQDGQIAARYFRLKYVVTSPTILAVGVNCANIGA